LAEKPSVAITGNQPKTNECNSTSTKLTTNVTDYAKELLSLKSEIESLKQTITMVVEQIMSAIKSITAPPCKPETNAMETKHENLLAEDHLNIPLHIADLKHKIATMIIKTLVSTTIFNNDQH